MGKVAEYCHVNVTHGMFPGVDVEIKLPENYPEFPPVVQILSPITHPNMTPDGVLEMRMLARWRDSYHLFQVIVELLRLFQKVPARCVEDKPQAVDSQEQLNPIIAQKEQLAVILEDKKKILNEIKNKQSQQLTNRALQQEKQKHLEDEILNVESELFAIEQQFEDYDISSLEFAKRFYNLKKRLYLLETKI